MEKVEEEEILNDSSPQMGVEMETYVHISEDDDAEIVEEPDGNGKNDHILFITPTGIQSSNHTTFPSSPAILTSPLELQTLG